VYGHASRLVKSEDGAQRIVLSVEIPCSHCVFVIVEVIEDRNLWVKYWGILGLLDTPPPAFTGMGRHGRVSRQFSSAYALYVACRPRPIKEE
jgi:hypothetical protein